MTAPDGLEVECIDAGALGMSVLTYLDDCDLTHLFHVLPILFEGRTLPGIGIIGAEIAAVSGGFELQLIRRNHREAVDDCRRCPVASMPRDKPATKFACASEIEQLSINLAA